jgi:soluble lytic murein transglycosylase-like protein
MAIPLFTGSVGSLPNIRPLTPGADPIESLELKGKLAGAELAESYENVQLKRQQQDLNRVTQARQELQLQQDTELAPLQLESERLKLQTQNSPEFQELQKNKIAQETRLLQQKNEFAAIFAGSDEQAKVDAVTSGKYAELFGAEPKLGEYAIRKTYNSMTPEQQNGMQEYLGQSWLYKTMFADRNTASKDYRESLAALTGNQRIADAYTTYFKGTDIRQFPDKVKFLRGDEFETDEKGEPILTADGQLTPGTRIGAEPMEGYVLLSKDNKILARNLEKKDGELLSAARTKRQIAIQAGVELQDLNGVDIAVGKAQNDKEAAEEKAKKEKAIADGMKAVGPKPDPTIPPGYRPKYRAPTTENLGGFSLFGGEFEAGTLEGPDGSTINRPAPATPSSPREGAYGYSAMSNTPDTNQRPQEALKAAVVRQAIESPEVAAAYSAASQRYTKLADERAPQLRRASFAPTVADTARMYKNDYRPAQVRDPIVTRVNSEPLLQGQPPIIKALAAVESGGKRDALSPTGVRGLLQVTRSTAAQYGLDRNIPEQNVQAGIKELSRNLKMVKKPELALAAYNAGVGTILQAIKATGSYDWDVIKDYLEDVLSPQKFAEVKNYPEKVLNYAAIFAGTEIEASDSMLKQELGEVVAPPEEEVVVEEMAAPDPRTPV